MDTPDLFDKVIYSPANRCIYCGATDVPLYDEHIWPDGLGGKHILPKSSCKPCEALINKEFEQYSLRHIFGLIRHKLGIRSSKKRPAQPVRLSVQRGAYQQTVIADEGHIPANLVLPVFPLPTVMFNKPPTRTIQISVWVWRSDDYDALLSRYHALSLSGSLDPYKVARFVAKIAHAFGTANLGDVFKPRLPDIILGKTDLYIEYVGSVGQEQSVSWPLHQIALGHTRIDGLGDFAVAYVRFFATYGAPLYCAVLGELTKPWPLKGRSDPRAISVHIPGTNPGF